MVHFKSIPFLKIILPYILGIVVFLTYGSFGYTHLLFFSLGLIWIISFFIQKLTSPHQLKKFIFIALSNILLFLAAYESCILYNARNYTNHYSHFITTQQQSVFARVDNISVRGEKFIKVPIEIIAIEYNQQWKASQGKSFLYIKNDESNLPRLGDVIFLKAKFNVINDVKNPDEFDYKSYLSRQNIFYVMYSGDIKPIIVPNLNHSLNITNIGVSIKSKLVDMLRDSQLSKDAFSITAALLLGYDDEIDTSVLQSFSHSGTLHILSVSGMHTGVLYAIFIWIFSLFDKHDRYKKLRFFVITSFLILFVLVTGVSPSVLRAALMLILMLFGQTFYKKGNSYNTLLFSAFLILLYNPYLLIDAGFLLSYFAVFGILYLYPLLKQTINIENKFLRLVWDSTLISLSATLFTLPISLYYFHQFPVWFVLANLIIIPISTGLLILTGLFLITYPITLIKLYLAKIINLTTSVMLWFSNLTNNPKYGYIDFIPFSVIDLVFLSLLIIFFIISFQFKSYRFLISSCWVCIIWLTSSIVINYSQARENELVVFYVKRKTAYIVRNGQSVFTSFNQITENEFQRYIKPYLLNISNLKLIPAENQLMICNKNIIGNTKFQETQQDPSIVIVSNNIYPKMNEQSSHNTILIADCSNSSSFIKKLKHYCYQRNITFYSVYESGSIALKL